MLQDRPHRLERAQALFAIDGRLRVAAPGAREDEGEDEDGARRDGSETTHRRSTPSSIGSPLRPTGCPSA
jgi:hypothetical protein